MIVRKYLLVLLLSSLFIGCSKDDSQNTVINPSIIGNWILESTQIGNDSPSISTKECIEKLSFTTLEDYTLERTSLNDIICPESNKTNGKYTVVDNIITFDSEFDSKFEIINNKLKIYYFEQVEFRETAESTPVFSTINAIKIYVKQ